MTQYEMNPKQATQRLSEEKTFVLWDINGCPIPDGVDPRQVRRRIESALKKSGYSGRLTITAIGDLRQTPGDNVLRELSSTGIALQHSHGLRFAFLLTKTDIVWGLYGWTFPNPSPATVMLISGHSQRRKLAPTLKIMKQEGYTTLLASPQDPAPLASPQDPAPDGLLKSYLLGVSKEWLWNSLLEGVTWTIINRRQQDLFFRVDLAAIAQYALLLPKALKISPRISRVSGTLWLVTEGEEKTLVLWHINSCPIPDGYNPFLVRPSIESALRKSGCSGSLTFSVCGNLLTQTPGANVLRELSSTGIALNHAHGLDSATLFSFIETEVEGVLLKWAHHNPSPATFMLISGPSQLECLFSTLHNLYSLRDTQFFWHILYEILLQTGSGNAFLLLLKKSGFGKAYWKMKWIQGLPDLFFRTSAVKRVSLPGLAQYAILVAKALKRENSKKSKSEEEGADEEENIETCMHEQVVEDMAHGVLFFS
ncbi:unnamed protein product [Thlaspi arvense]|uniref:NYN domain-containing protein n=1 Tax=Thlaspi arvense TaxID=13288 RepID=A0AAU9SFG1_THLAR|nr:unnamed protein product [Thlaspi arvense]